MVLIYSPIHKTLDLRKNVESLWYDIVSQSHSPHLQSRQNESIMFINTLLMTGSRQGTVVASFYQLDRN